MIKIMNVKAEPHISGSLGEVEHDIPKLNRIVPKTTVHTFQRRQFILSNSRMFSEKNPNTRLLKHHHFLDNV